VGNDEWTFWAMAALAIVVIIALLTAKKTRMVMTSIFRSPLTTSHLVPTSSGWTSIDAAHDDEDDPAPEDDSETPASAVDLMEALRNSVLRAREARGGIPQQRTREDVPEPRASVARQRFTEGDFDSVRHHLDQMERRVTGFRGTRAFSGDRRPGDVEDQI
jgi:hypothetical protein